jgi:hypothetical protein
MLKFPISILSIAPCILVLAGCLHTARPAPTATAEVPPAVTVDRPIENEFRRTVSRPGIQKAYFVGRLVDPKHPELMRGSGIVYRRERAEGWDLATPTEDEHAYATGPIRSLPNGSEIAGMTAADAEIQEARTSSMIDKLLEQNADLVDQLADATSPIAAAEEKPEAPKRAPAKPFPLPPAKITRTLPSPSETEALVTIAPSADNIIELSPSLLEPPIPGLTNPFRQRYQFETQLRETKIVVSGIALGPQPSCVLGDRIYNVGDVFESFIIASIDGEGIFLRKESFLLRIPMQDTPIQLRYP